MLKRKGFAPILLLVIILLLAVTSGIGYYIYSTSHKQIISQTSQSVKNSPPNIENVNPNVATGSTINATPINQGQIGLIENNKIQLLDTSNWQKKEIPIPSTIIPNYRDSHSQITFSRDGNILFTDSVVEEDNTSFVIYNLLTDKMITLPKMDPGPRVESSDDVSPDGKHFILYQSCCPGDSGRTIIAIDGKVIKSQSGGVVVWSPDSKSLAISKAEIELNLQIDVSNSSIYLQTINGSLVSEKLLIKATYQQNYYPIKWIDSNALLIGKVTFKQSFPENLDPNDEKQMTYWMDVFDNPTKTYFTIDVNTLQVKEATYTPQPVNNSILNDNSEINISYSPDKKWKAYTQGTGVVGPSFISKIDGSNKIKISDKAFVAWKPQ